MVYTYCNEDITYDGIVEHSNSEIHHFNFNVDVEHNDLQAGNYSTSSSNDNSETNEGSEPQKPTRQDLNKKQQELLDKFQNEDILCRLIKNLDEVKLTEDFLHLIDILSTGEMENGK